MSREQLSAPRSSLPALRQLGMKTEVAKISPAAPEAEVIEAAAEILRRGGLVAFPTETVYGLGADALNPQAVLKIFAVKGRPPDNPIIVHIAAHEQLELVAREIPDPVRRLATEFWPGPLTFVLPKTERVPRETTGGLDTVAVRMPDSLVALRLIEALGRPIAAPSANLSGRPSPTAAEHVYEDLSGQIEMILDSGPTRIGVESTVLDLTRTPPAILRPGGITLEQLQPIVGEIVLTAEAEALRRSPGTRYRHYSPRAQLILIERWQEEKHRPLVKQLVRGLHVVGYVGLDRRVVWPGCHVHVVEIPPDPDEYASRIFAILRELDQLGVEAILVEGIEEKGLGTAVMDRLRRAASQVV